MRHATAFKMKEKSPLLRQRPRWQGKDGRGSPAQPRPSPAEQKAGMDVKPLSGGRFLRPGTTQSCHLLGTGPPRPQTHGQSEITACDTRAEAPQLQRPACCLRPRPSSPGPYLTAHAGLKSLQAPIPAMAHRRNHFSSDEEGAKMQETPSDLQKSNQDPEWSMGIPDPHKRPPVRKGHPTSFACLCRRGLREALFPSGYGLLSHLGRWTPVLTGSQTPGGRQRLVGRGRRLAGGSPRDAPELQEGGCILRSVFTSLSGSPGMGPFSSAPSSFIKVEVKTTNTRTKQN